MNEKQDRENEKQFRKGKINHGLPGGSIANSTSQT